MAERSARRKPRVRKAPTVRQQIEEKVARDRSAGSRQRRQLIGPILKRVLSPLAIIGRPLSRFLLWLTPSYFINAWQELRQVSWPNRRETWRLTGAVLVFAVVFGALVAVVDKGLDELFKRVILR